MDGLRYASKSFNLMNVVLLGGLICLLVFVVLPLFHMKARYAPPHAPFRMQALEEPFPAQAPGPPALDFAMIGENNLFHPERRVPQEKKSQQPLPRPELVLYGTVVSDDASVAFVEDKKSPRTSAGRGKRQSVIKRGDTIGGFVLKEILTDRIVLSRGEESMTVHLIEAGKQREGGTQGPMKAAAAPPPGGMASPPPAAASAPITTAAPANKSEPQKGQAPQIKRRILWQGKELSVDGG